MSHLKNSSLPLSLIATAALLSLYLSPAAAASAPLYTDFPVAPKFKISALAGSILAGGVNSLVPFYGNPDDLVFFAGLEGDYGSHNAYLASPGVGARFIKQNQLFGTYLYGDYNRSSYGGSFFVYNPGIEWMSAHWDAHLNGYFLQTHRQRLKSLGFLSDQGNYSFSNLSGHGAIDHELIQYDIAGNGADAEIGYSLNIHGRRGRIYAGAYHYSAQSASHINGGQAGFDYLINSYMNVGLVASHDNLNQTKGAFTISFILGNLTSATPTDVRERLNDFIPRHLGTLNTASGLPTQRKAIANGAVRSTGGNLWFFNPGIANLTGFAAPSPQISLSQCTAENPCTGLSQAMVDGINALQPNAALYLAPGNYTYTNPTTLNLNAGQSVWGRNTGYQTAAVGNDRALIVNGISLVDNNTLDSLRITNTSSVINSVTVGIYSNNTLKGTFNLNNLDINASSNTTFVRGILLQGNSQGNMALTNSTINASAFGTNVSSSAIRNDSLSSTTIANSVLNANATSSFGNAYTFVNINGNATIENTTINATANGVGGNVNPIINYDKNISITNSSINATNFGSGAGSVVLNGGIGTITIDHSTLSGKVMNVSSGPMNILYLPGTGAINVTNTQGTLSNISNTNNGPALYLDGGSMKIDNSQFITQSTGTQSNFGLYAGGNSTLTLSNSSLNVSAANNSAYGVQTFSSSPVIFNNVSITIAGNNASALKTGTGTFNQTGGSCSLNGGIC